MTPVEKETIRSFCFRRFAAGVSADEVWKEVQAHQEANTKFAGNVASWTYIQRLGREYASAPKAPVPIGFDGDEEVKF
jgi:hypothetical protein